MPPAARCAEQPGAEAQPPRDAWAYAYPASRAAWKKTMHVFHTAGVPPSSGRIICAIIGWTTNSSEALTKSVNAKERT